MYLISGWDQLTGVWIFIQNIIPNDCRKVMEGVLEKQTGINGIYFILNGLAVIGYIPCVHSAGFVQLDSGMPCLNQLLNCFRLSWDALVFLDFLDR